VNDHSVADRERKEKGHERQSSKKDRQKESDGDEGGKKKTGPFVLLEKGQINLAPSDRGKGRQNKLSRKERARIPWEEENKRKKRKKEFPFDISTVGGGNEGRSN